MPRIECDSPGLILRFSANSTFGLSSMNRTINHAENTRSTPGPLRLYDHEMGRAASVRIRIAAGLLCMVLAWLPVSSPHCDLCDGFHTMTLSSSSQPSVRHSALPEPDTCNGICACCGFHWLSDSRPISTSLVVERDASRLTPLSPPRTPRSPFLRPPRISRS